MTEQEFLDDFIEYYGNNPERRSIDDSDNPSVIIGTAKIMCLYKSPNGNKCAIGRYIPEEVYSEELEKCSPEFVINLCPNLRGLDVDFLRAMQRVHDNKDYWTLKCLNPYGFRIIEKIKNDYHLI